MTLNVDPARTALIVVDMQRDFLDPLGMVEQEGDDATLLRAILPRVRRLVDWARDRGLTVVHTREGYAPDLSDMNPVKRARYGANAAGPLGRFLIRGEAGHDFHPDMMPGPGEWVIDKPGFGAFFATDLESRLRGAGVETLILCGVTTGCCVSSTLREAVDRGFDCVTVADCCAAIELDDHDRALDLIAGEGHLFGAVTTLAAIAGPSPRPLPPGVALRPMTDADAEPVLAIYEEGITTGHATFQETTGSWEDFKTGKSPTPRLVATVEDRVLGFATVSPTSTRAIYRGVQEVSLYVSSAATGRGIGHALMARLVEDAREAGLWQLTAGIFPENKASLILHAAHGFRCVGRQARAGRMPYGPLAGQWRDVLRLHRNL
jgi:nicotinamidase-related amidase/L-amino acid N-acyltransferase YncA